jgi:CDGSH-type Zn-finger protein
MTNQSAEPRIEVRENGPYVVAGAPLIRMRPVRDEHGRPVAWERVGDVPAAGTYELCRCGASGTKPFCDGSEERVGFDGTETADRGPGVERRFVFGTDPLILSDDRSICSTAGFCTLTTTDAWELVDEATDPLKEALLRRMVRNCPSGRLALHAPPDPAQLEEELPREIGVVDNGPLWLRGGIPVTGADGFEYEVRNRATLCRCGHSMNKPFCDGSHIRVGFVDPEQPKA